MFWNFSFLFRLFSMNLSIHSSSFCKAYLTSSLRSSSSLMISMKAASNSMPQFKNSSIYSSVCFWRSIFGQVLICSANLSFRSLWDEVESREWSLSLKLLVLVSLKLLILIGVNIIDWSLGISLRSMSRLLWKPLFLETFLTFAFIFYASLTFY